MELQVFFCIHYFSFYSLPFLEGEKMRERESNGILFHLFLDAKDVLDENVTRKRMIKFLLVNKKPETRNGVVT